MAKSKKKGSAYELEVVKAHHSLGVAARKMPLSGALGGIYSGDVIVAGLTCECKRRKRGFSTLYKYMEQGSGNDVLFLRDDREETLVVLPWATWASFLFWADIQKHHPYVEESEDGQCS